MKKICSTILAATMVVSGLATVKAGALDSDKFVELSGSDRYATSIELSKHAYPNTANAVVIASGKNFADALAGSTLASIKNGPLLLVGDSLTNNISDEIERLKPKEIFILGGVNSVSARVESSLSVSGRTVSRISGADRYQTSLEIAKKIRSLNGGSDKTVLVVSGTKFADALSAGSVGAKLKAPLILTNGTSLPTGYGDVMDSSNSNGNYIVGGTASVNIAGLNGTRVSGDNRYETSAKLAEKFFPNNKFAAVASGEVFPDGLSAITLYNKYTMPILLTEKYNLSSPVKNYLVNNKVSGAVIVGGTNSISYSVRNTIKESLNQITFALKNPVLVKPIEKGDKDIIVKITEEMKSKGNVEVYIQDSYGKYPDKPNKTAEYIATKNEQEIKINVYGNLQDGFTVGKKVKFRLVSSESTTDKPIESNFVETTVVDTQDSAYKEFNRLNNSLVVEVPEGFQTKELKEAFAKVLSSKLNNKYNATYNFDNTVSENFNSSGEAVYTLKGFKIEAKNSNDSYTGDFKFKVKKVKNAIESHVLNIIKPDKPLVYVYDEAKEVVIRSEVTKSGTVAEDEFVITTENVTISPKISPEFEVSVAKNIALSSDNKAVYDTTIKIPKQTPDKEYTVSISVGKSKKFAQNTKFEVTNSILKGIKIGEKIYYEGEIAEFEYDKILDSDNEVKVKIEPAFDGNSSNQDLSAFNLSSTFETGAGVVTDGVKAELVPSGDAKEKYIVFNDNPANNKKDHSFVYTLTYTDKEKNITKNVKVKFHFVKKTEGN